MSLLRLLQSCASFRAVCLKFTAVSFVAVVVAVVAGLSARGADYVLPESGEAYFRHEQRIQGLWFADDERYVYTWAGNVLRLWDLPARRVVAEAPLSIGFQVLGGDDRRLILGDNENRYVVLDARTLKPMDDEAAKSTVGFMTSVRKAHPGKHDLVSHYWDSPGGAAACVCGDKFRFARRAGETSWDDVQLGRGIAAYAPAAMTLVYSDEPTGRRDPAQKYYILCERFKQDGTRAPALKVEVPKGALVHSLAISADSELIAFAYRPDYYRRGAVGEEADYVVEVYRVSTQERLGHAYTQTNEPHSIQFDTEGRALMVSSDGLAIIYDIGQTTIGERTRFRPCFEKRRGIVVAAKSLGVMALHTHGHGFTLVDPAKPKETRVANAVDLRPLGLWGDDVVLLESSFGVTCAPLGPATKDCPKLDLPPTSVAALSEDRRCLIYATDQGKVTVRLRERTLLQDFDDDTKIKFVAVSGSGDIWATAYGWDIRIMRRSTDGTYAEAGSFDAGAEVCDLKFSADGKLLLAQLKASQLGRAVVYRETGGAWRPMCGPFDYGDVVDLTTFAAGGRMVVSLALEEPAANDPFRPRLEVRRTADDTVAADTLLPPGQLLTSLHWRQLGDQKKLPLIRDGRLTYRDLETQKETTTETTFAKGEEPLIVYGDLGRAIISLPDGRLAVRTLGK